MVLEPPNWLHAEFMQKVLRSSKNDDTIEVTDIKMQPATAVGDNYLSEMFRVNIMYSRNESLSKIIDKQSFIIKTAFNHSNKDIIVDLGVFDTEISMMEDTLVRMNKMLEIEGCRLSPRTLYTARNPSLIVMEDLSTLGFCMADRQMGLDLDHCIYVMRGLARFHATSIAIREKDPKALVAYNGNPIVKQDACVNFHKSLLQGIANEILGWQELGSSRQAYSEKITKLSHNYNERYLACTAPKDDEFIVLNHGDCWVNNMLFKYDNNGKITDHLFVDFQLSFLSSPAVDVLTLASSSFSEDVAFHHYDTLLEEYLTILKKTMTRLHCSSKAPDMASLKKTLEKYQIVEVVASCLYLPITLVEKNDAQTLDKLLQVSECYQSPVIKTMAFRKIIGRLLPKWNASGVFDF